jgi:hypothetical protein
MKESEKIEVMKKVLAISNTDNDYILKEGGLIEQYFDLSSELMSNGCFELSEDVLMYSKKLLNVIHDGRKLRKRIRITLSSEEA